MTHINSIYHPTNTNTDTHKIHTYTIGSQLADLMHDSHRLSNLAIAFTWICMAQYSVPRSSDIFSSLLLYNSIHNHHSITSTAAPTSPSYVVWLVKRSEGRICFLICVLSYKIHHTKQTLSPFMSTSHRLSFLWIHVHKYLNFTIVIIITSDNNGTVHGRYKDRTNSYAIWAWFSISSGSMVILIEFRFIAKSRRNYRILFYSIGTSFNGLKNYLTHSFLPHFLF